MIWKIFRVNVKMKNKGGRIYGNRKKIKRKWKLREVRVERRKKKEE